MADLVIPESGFVNVKLGGGEPVPVDLYLANNRLMTIDAKVRDELANEPDSRQVEEYLRRVCQFIEDIGLGRVSHDTADQFEKAIFKAVDDLKKARAGGPTPA